MAFLSSNLLKLAQLVVVNELQTVWNKNLLKVEIPPKIEMIIHSYRLLNRSFKWANKKSYLYELSSEDKILSSVIEKSVMY